MKNIRKHKNNNIKMVENLGYDIALSQYLKSLDHIIQDKKVEKPRSCIIRIEIPKTTASGEIKILHKEFKSTLTCTYKEIISIKNEMLEEVRGFLEKNPGSKRKFTKVFPYYRHLKRPKESQVRGSIKKEQDDNNNKVQ